MDDLPSEMVERIVSNITDFHVLLELRLVSSRWKSVIQNWLSRRKSLAITMANYMIHNQHHSTLKDRFFGTLGNERFIIIKLHNFITAFDVDFTFFIMKLFRRVRHLAFRAPLMTLHGTTSLLLMLTKWHKLSTLSLITCTQPIYHIPIASAINRLENLVRLDVGLPFDMSALRPTLARIHHLALGFNMSRNEFLNIIRTIGSHCQYLWVAHWYRGVVHPGDITAWMRANPAFFERLTHFGCLSDMTDSALEVIDRHFTSLTTWYVAAEYRAGYVRFGSLSRLRELRVLHLLGPFPLMGITNEVRPICSVRTFELHQACCSPAIPTLDEVKIFIDRLRFIFPRVEKVVLTSPHRRTIQLFRQCDRGGRQVQVLQSKAPVWVPT